MKNIIMLIICLLLIGCNPGPPIEPVTSIYITPEHSEIGLNESIELFCFDQLDRATMAVWSKRCSAGVLSDDLGVSITYTTPRSMTGIQEIYAKYNGFKATAKVKGVK